MQVSHSLEVFRQSNRNSKRSAVQSHFDYCSVVWGNCAKTLSDKLQIELSACLLILVMIDADANQLLNELGWDNLETRRQKLKAEMVYKSLNGLAPNSLSSKFIQRSDVITAYNLRDSDVKLGIPLPRTNYLTIRPVALSGYGSIAHEAKPNGLLTRGP